jgi:hypothetical protein
LIDLGELTLEIECVKSDLSIERNDVVTGGGRTDDFAERFLDVVSLTRERFSWECGAASDFPRAAAGFVFANYGAYRCVVGPR